jgi:hypothetical protein
MGRWVGGGLPRLVPRTFYSLCEAAEEIGRRLFSDAWTGEEVAARNLPPRDEGTLLLEERNRFKRAAAEAGMRGHPPYDLLDPPPAPPNFGGGAGMGEPDTPLNRIRRRLWETEWVERWPEVGSSEYETERAAYARWAQAESELIEALREGYLTAVVRKPDGHRYQLLPSQWRSELARYSVRDSRFASRALYGTPFYGDHCEVSAASLQELLGLNEATAIQPPSARTSAFGYRTGFPGRPNLKSAVTRLAEERARSGNAEETIAAEAEALASEIRRLYPEAPSHPTARTIETQVRKVRQRLRNETAK